eukprot:scaffold24379_cov50-Phaeocystis_antarctica.AAC.1
MVEHKGMVNLLHHVREGQSSSGWGQALHRPDAAPLRFAVTNNYAFDWFQLCLFSSLACHGGICHLLQDSLALLDLPESAGVACIADVPSVISTAQLPSTVRYVDSGGEGLTLGVVESLKEQVSLYNSYGPTEVTIDSVGRLVSRRHSKDRMQSIGHLLPN